MTATGYDNMEPTWQSLKRLHVELLTRYLSRKDRLKIICLIVLTTLFGILDILSLYILSQLINLVSEADLENNIKNPEKMFNWLGLDITSNLAIFILALLLVTKSIGNFLGNKKLNDYGILSAGKATSEIIKKLSTSAKVVNQKIDKIALPHHVIYGLETAFIQVFLSSFQIISDSVILLLLIIGVVFIAGNESIIICFIIFFFLALARSISKKVRQTGEEYIDARLKSASYLHLMIGANRELVLGGFAREITEEIILFRLKSLDSVKKLNVIQGIFKYVVEGAISLLLVLVIMVLLIGNGLNSLLSFGIVVVVFLRVLPGLSRVQQNMISIRANVPTSIRTLDYLNLLNLTLESSVKEIEKEDVVTFHNVKSKEKPDIFLPIIEFDDVSFRFSLQHDFLFKSQSFVLQGGETVFLNGESGSGKSTLIDVMLGFEKPSTGNVFLSGLRPEDAITRWPGKVSLVQQNPIIINGSLRDNLLLKERGLIKSDNELISILQLVGLFEKNPDLNWRLLNESNAAESLSGGEKQRLILARALASDPEILLLDESFNALDETARFDIYKNLRIEFPSLLIVVVSHNSIDHEHASRIITL